MESPNRLNLKNGSYILWDTVEGVFRVAYYERRQGKGGDIKLAISVAIKKPLWSKEVQQISEYIEGQNATAST